jgi:hypothetical protein
MGSGDDNDGDVNGRARKDRRREYDPDYLAAQLLIRTESGDISICPVAI